MRPRARDHGGLVALVYGYRAVSGALLALPVAVLLGGASAHDPRGSAVIFDPGGVMFFEALRLARRGEPAVMAGSAALGLVAVLLSVLPLGAVLVGLARDDRVPRPELAAGAVRHAPTLLAIGVLGALLQLLVAGVVMVVGGRVAGSLGSSASSALREDIAMGATIVAAFLGAALVGLARDVGSTVAVREELRFYSACALALGHLRTAGGELLLAWAGRGALAVLGFGLAAWFAPSGRITAWYAVLVALALHQWAVALASALHLSWLAAVLRVVDRDGER